MRPLGEIDRAAWLEIARQDRAATFFQTPMWAEVAAAAGSWRAAARGFELNDGHRAVYPAVRESTGPVTLASTFAGCYGGPLATRPLTPLERAELHRRFVKSGADRVVLTLGPFAEPGRLPQGAATTADVTHAVRLDADFETMLMRFSRGHRPAYRKGLREGVVVRDEPPSALVDAYQALNLDTLERRGGESTSRYGREVFACLARLADMHPDHVRLWTARHEGELLAGLWVLYFNRHAVLWHTAERTVERTTPPWTISMWGEVMRDAIERGCGWLDFNPSHGNEGSIAFKRRFGAEELPVLRVRFYRARTRVAGRLARLAPGRGL